jgi:glycosyltransferase involved in cell wall biosynthesis
LTPIRFGFLTYGLDRPAFGISRAMLSMGRAFQRHSAAEPLFITPYRGGAFTEPGTRRSYLPGSRLAPGLMTVGALELPVLARRHRLPLIHDPSVVTPFLVGRSIGRYKRVVTLHDATALLHPDTHTLLDNFLYRVYIPAGLRNVDAVITLSESAKRDLRRFLRFPAGRIHVVPLAAERAFSPLAADVVRSTLARHQLEPGFVLYVGALEPRKNVPTLLRAFARLRREVPGVRLVIVGAPRWKFSAIPRVLDELRLRDAVQFTGYVADADLPALYSAASVFCFPSLAEGFGLPVLEAMACGTPVVCSNASALPEVAGDAAVLVEPTDAEAIAVALKRVLQQPETAAQLRQQGLARAARFSWERTATETLDVYSRVLNET